jgi:hypothetical protein
MMCRTRILGIAERPRRLHELELPCTQHLPPDQPRIANPTNQRERDDDVRQTGAEHGDHGNGQQQTGKCEQDVHQPAQNFVDDSAEEQRADRGGDSHDDQADEQRDPGAYEDAREDIAPKLVEAEPVAGTRPLEPQREFLI